MIVDINAKYVKGKVRLVKKRYERADGPICIQGENPETGEPLFKATVNLLMPPRKGHVWLKGWSENEGIPQALADAGIVKLTGTHAYTGHASADEACLLVDIPE